MFYLSVCPRWAEKIDNCSTEFSFVSNSVLIICAIEEGNRVHSVPLPLSSSSTSVSFHVYNNQCYNNWLFSERQVESVSSAGGGTFDGKDRRVRKTGSSSEGIGLPPWYDLHACDWLLISCFPFTQQNSTTVSFVCFDRQTFRVSWRQGSGGSEVQQRHTESNKTRIQKVMIHMSGKNKPHIYFGFAQ